MPFHETVGEPGIRFKSDELSRIASVSQTANTVCVCYTAGVKTIEDARHQDVIMSASVKKAKAALSPASSTRHPKSSTSSRRRFSCGTIDP
jgi:hypothetical protein